MPVKRMNTLAICSFIWLVMAASVMMFALPAVTPAATRNGAKFIFTEWIPSSASAVSASATALAPAPAFAPPLPPAGGTACGLNTTVNTACGTYTLLPNCTMPSSFAPSCQQAVAANVGLVTNLPSEGWNAMVGLLMTQYLMTYYDVPSHMAEETHDAARTVRLSVWHTTRFLRFSRPRCVNPTPSGRRLAPRRTQVPRAIVTSFLIAGVTNLGMLISFVACLDLSYYQYDFLTLAPLISKDDRVASGNFLFGGVTNGVRPPTMKPTQHTNMPR